MSYLKTVRNYVAIGSIGFGAVGATSLVAYPLSIHGMMRHLSDQQRQSLAAVEEYKFNSTDTSLSDFVREHNRKELATVLLDPKLREIIETRDTMRTIAGPSLLLAVLGGLFCMGTMNDRRRR